MILIGENKWTITKDLKIVFYKSQKLNTLLNNGMFFDTVEEATHYKRYILNTEYGKMGAKDIPQKLDEEETLKREVSKLKNRLEHSNKEMLGLLFQEPLHETILWKQLLEIEKEYDEVVLKWKMIQVEYGEKIAEFQRISSNYFNSGALGGNPMTYSRDFKNRQYLNNNDKVVIELSKQLKNEHLKYKKYMEEKDFPGQMIRLIDKYFNTYTERLWIRQAWTAKTKYEKQLFNLELVKLHNRFFSGCDVFERVFIDELNNTKIKYNEERKIYNLIFYTKNGPTFLKWIGQTDKRPILMDHKGRVHNNLSLCFIDKSINGMPIDDNEENIYWEDDEYW